VSDAATIDQVVGLLRSDVDWTKAGLVEALSRAGWQSDGKERPPDYPVWRSFGEVHSSVSEFEETVVWELTFELWELDLDDEDRSDYEQLEALAKPRMDALRELFAQRATDWLPGAISVPELDEWYPYVDSHGWHTDTLSVETGYLIHDNGLPLMLSLRAYQNPK